MTINLDQYTNTLNVTDTATNADLNVNAKNSGNVIITPQSTNAVGLVIAAPAGSTSNSGRIFFDSTAGVSAIANIGGNQVSFRTAATIGTSSGSVQALVSHTASAVNYVQATGGATGSFPSITAQGSDTNIDFVIRAKGNFSTFIGNTNGIGIQAYAPASTVNYFQTAGSPTGSGITLSAQGADSNIQIYYASKGTNPHSFLNGAGNEQFRVASTASAVNYVQVTGNATGGGPSLSTQGSDTNINFFIRPKNSGALIVNTGGGFQLTVIDTASAVNWAEIKGGATGSGPQLAAVGSDTNIDLFLTPKGTGNVRFGTYTANMALTIQGYVEIKDSGCTVRRLAVIA